MIELSCTEDELRDGVRWELFDEAGITKPHAFALFELITEHSLPAGTWHSWLSRKRLAPIGKAPFHRPTYRLGHVRTLALGWIEHRESTEAVRPMRVKHARTWVPAEYLRAPSRQGGRAPFGYAAAHQRVRAAHGAPRTCLHCGDGSRESHNYHWALNWGRNPETLIDPTNGMHYSLDPDDYFRLCCTCHLAFDREHAKATRDTLLA